MSVTFNFDVITQFAATIDTSTRAGLLQAGEHIRDLASQLAPYDPKDVGVHLRDSGEVNVDYESGRTLVHVEFGDSLPDIRAIAQEFGTVYQEAQPFLTPAATQIDVLKEVADHLFDKLRTR